MGADALSSLKYLVFSVDIFGFRFRDRMKPEAFEREEAEELRGVARGLTFRVLYLNIWVWG